MKNNTSQPEPQIRTNNILVNHFYGHEKVSLSKLLDKRSYGLGSGRDEHNYNDASKQHCSIIFGEFLTAINNGENIIKYSFLRDEVPGGRHQYRFYFFVTNRARILSFAIDTNYRAGFQIHQVLYEVLDFDISGNDTATLMELLKMLSSFEKSGIHINNVKAIFESCIAFLKSRIPTQMKHEPEETSTSPTEREECCVCVENKITHIIIPCAHFCLCEKCSKELPKNICPMCRSPIENIYKVYFCVKLNLII